MITTLFNKYNFNIANLYRFSHLQPFRLLFGSFMGTGWNFTRARIFSSLFISLLPRDSNWQKRKEKKRGIKRRRRKKERKKRGKEEEKKTKKDFLSYIFAKFHARWMNHRGRRVGSLKSGNHFACLFFSPPCHGHASISIQLLNIAQSPP